MRESDFACNACRRGDSAHFYKRVMGIDGQEYTLVRCDVCGVAVYVLAAWRRIPDKAQFEAYEPAEGFRSRCQ